MPWGIKELKSFFSEGIKMKNGDSISSTIVKSELKKILDNENKKNPLNDESITKKLNNKGYLIARRTVSKYRESLRIPVSRLRKI
jgi:RNA polymerase sigma-54 factor